MADAETADLAQIKANRESEAAALRKVRADYKMNKAKLKALQDKVHKYEGLASKQSRKNKRAATMQLRTTNVADLSARESAVAQFTYVHR